MTWLPIKDFPNYVVNEFGQVAKAKTLKLLSFSTANKGFTSYNRVTLFKENVRYYRQVHRLVAEAFIKNPNNLPQIDHLDGNGLNNFVENLDWCTAAENIQRSFERNPEAKLQACSRGGRAGSFTTRKRSENKYKEMLGERFLKFHPSGAIHTDAAVTYACECGVIRTATIMFKELRVHRGKCPMCTNTVNRSSPSLEY